MLAISITIRGWFIISWRMNSSLWKHEYSNIAELCSSFRGKFSGRRGVCTWLGVMLRYCSCCCVCEGALRCISHERRWTELFPHSARDSQSREREARRRSAWLWKEAPEKLNSSPAHCFLFQLSVRWWMRCPAAYLMPRPDRPRAEEKPLKTRRVLRWVRFSRGNLNVTGARAAPDFQRYATLRWMKTPDSISPVNYFIFRLNV